VHPLLTLQEQFRALACMSPDPRTSPRYGGKTALDPRRLGTPLKFCFLQILEIGADASSMIVERGLRYYCAWRGNRGTIQRGRNATASDSAQMTSLQPRNQPIQRWSRETVAMPGIQVQLDATGHAVCMSKRKVLPQVSWNWVWRCTRKQCNTNVDSDRS
jgi:hypothetical protein